MRVLLDTNIILRAVQPLLPIWPTINDSLSSLVAQNYRLCIVPQTIYEFWVVLTRPISQNGFGLNPNEAMESIKRTRSNFLILLDIARRAWDLQCLVWIGDSVWCLGKGCSRR